MAKTIKELVQSLVSDLISKRDEKINTKVSEASASVINEINKDELATKAELTNLASKSDLNDLAKKSELNDFATKSEISNLAKKSDIPAAYDDSSIKSSISSLQGSLGEKVDKNGFIKNGYIYNSVNLSGGSNALLFNESDGGGAIFYNKENDIRSYAGVNDGMKDGSGVCALFYAINYTTGEGTRFSINPTKGAFYIKGPKGQGLPEGREVAVKDDINSLLEEINALKARIATLEGTNKPVDNTEEP